MAHAIKLTVTTKDNLLITTSIDFRGKNQFGDFSIEPFFPAIETTEKPKHTFDINNNKDPVAVDLDEFFTDLVSRNLSSIQNELKKHGMELSGTEPIKIDV